MKKVIQLFCLLQLVLGAVTAQNKLQLTVNQCNTLQAQLIGPGPDGKVQSGYAFWLEREVLPGVWSMQERQYSRNTNTLFQHLKTGSYRVSCTPEAIENDGVERSVSVSNEKILSAAMHISSCDADRAADATNAQTSADNIVISPNPAKDVIRFFMKEGPIAEQTELNLMDATGRVVLKEKLTSSDQTIQVSQLAPGVYFAQVRCQNNTLFQQKLLIINTK